jgi:hypothetical protein
MREAAGSKARAKIKTMKLVARTEYVNQGVTARRVMIRANPGKLREDIELLAFGRAIGTMTVGTDGETSYRTRSYTETLPLTRRQLGNIALTAAWDPLTDGMELLGTPEIERSDTVDDEPVIVLRTRIPAGGSILWHVSTRSFRVLKQESFTPARVGGDQRRNSTRFEDYRSMGGVMIPHRSISKTPLGEVIDTVQSVEMDANLPADAFAE